MASSLYIEIRGDYTEFKKDLLRVRGIARQNGEAISNALNNSISPDKAVKGISRLTQSLRQAHAAAAAGSVHPAIEGMEELAKAAGMSAREMGRLQRAMIETARQNSLSQAFADIQRQIDQAMAQLKYSQLDDFSQAQLQRKIQSLQNDKADMLWERGIEDRRAAANEEYDTAAEQLNNEKEAINNSLEVLRTLNDTVATGITDLEETIKAAMEAVKPDSTFNLVINNADKMTVDQLMELIENQYGSTGAI